MIKFNMVSWFESLSNRIDLANWLFNRHNRWSLTNEQRNDGREFFSRYFLSLKYNCYSSRTLRWIDAENERSRKKKIERFLTWIFVIL